MRTILKMGETNSKLETFEDSCRSNEANEVTEEYPSTCIDSEYIIINNSEFGESSLEQSHEFHLKKQTFLRECLEKNIFLEGLVTSIFMDDSNITDVFTSGIAKAKNFSELGDIQTVLSAFTQWCMKLHTKSGNSETQKAAWFHKNGFKETTFKEIDKQLRNRYAEVISLVSDLKKPTILNFNKDVLHVHETMMEIMAKLWHNRLCIYQGHKDLGYMQISSSTPGLIGRKSCYRLKNEPPRFVLALDALNNDHIPEELNLLVAIGDDLAASMLSRYHNTIPKDTVDQFFCIPVATEYISFELGSLASSEIFFKKLKSICGHVMKVLYDRDLKQMTVLCPKVGCDRAKYVLEKELENLKAELETIVLEIPFPHLHSPLRIQIGEGLKCLVVMGFHPPEIQAKNSTSTSYTSDAAEIYPTQKENQSMSKSKIDYQCNNQHLAAVETSVELESFNESLIAKHKYILIDDKVVFDSSVEVILHCRIKDQVKDEVSMTCKDAKTMIMSDVYEVFAEAGLRADGCEDSAATLVETNLETRHEFDLKIVFPNIYCARVGTRCIEGISRSDFSVFLRHRTKLSTDLKTIRITITKGFYEIIEKPLQEFLEKMQKENIVEHWMKQDQHVLVKPSSMNLQVLVSVTTTENYHTRSLTQDLEEFFLPAKVSFDNEQLHYLQSNEGTKFLKFLMQFTNTCIHIPTFQEKVHIYGDPSNKNQSANILKRQLAGRAKGNPCDLSWYLFDFDKTCYNTHALKNLYHSMKSHLDNLKRNSDISQYYFFEDSPELWLETKAYAYQRYSEEIKSTLLQSMDVPLDTKGKKLDLICSVCWHDNLDALSANCYLLSVCGHAYCKKCLLQLIIQSTKDRRVPVKCCFENCDKCLSAAELWYICGVMQYYKIRKILRDVLKSFVMDNTASFGLCPRQRCGAMCVVYHTEKMKACLLCQGRFCLYCDSDFHGTKTCDEVWSIEAWLKADVKNRKRCPNCSIPIEKDEGCSVVFCAWCKHYICWECAEFNSEIQRECTSHTLGCRSRVR